MQLSCNLTWNVGARKIEVQPVLSFILGFRVFCRPGLQSGLARVALSAIASAIACRRLCSMLCACVCCVFSRSLRLRCIRRVMCLRWNHILLIGFAYFQLCKSGAFEVCANWWHRIAPTYSESVWKHITNCFGTAQNR